jgi:hypothetical protein
MIRPGPTQIDTGTQRVFEAGLTAGDSVFTPGHRVWTAARAEFGVCQLRLHDHQPQSLSPSDPAISSSTSSLNGSLRNRRAAGAEPAPPRVLAQHVAEAHTGSMPGSQDRARRVVGIPRRRPVPRRPAVREPAGEEDRTG